MQHCGNKRNYLHCGSCIGLLLSLYQPTNHEQSLQLISGVWVIG